MRLDSPPLWRAEIVSMPAARPAPSRRGATPGAPPAPRRSAPRRARGKAEPRKEPLRALRSAARAGVARGSRGDTLQYFENLSAGGAAVFVDGHRGESLRSSIAGFDNCWSENSHALFFPSPLEGEDQRGGCRCTRTSVPKWRILAQKRHPSGEGDFVIARSPSSVIRHPREPGDG